jgi:hypothetical protein
VLRILVRAEPCPQVFVAVLAMLEKQSTTWVRERWVYPSLSYAQKLRGMMGLWDAKVECVYMIRELFHWTERERFLITSN